MSNVNVSKCRWQQQQQQQLLLPYNSIFWTMLKVEQPERERDPFFFFLTKVVERERDPWRQQNFTKRLNRMGPVQQGPNVSFLHIWNFSILYFWESCTFGFDSLRIVWIEEKGRKSRVKLTKNKLILDQVYSISL